ncbi:rRNA processing protein, putative [Paecilomyces variotii No. 5]|uniref:rRNA processing protein, putative n=1 Tax=Byssochlamys spectabilis (strain No. 5 / NBRC 109023) TaxID=1356009 RepID=V5FLA7_BYSSN|nr:rRNA processing protein, putative [Paecilomyces variotii No. 5]
MRAKRSKKYRKLMHQYELTFGFREPYQVLVDSNFLRQVHSFKMDLIPALERTVQGKVKPLLTKCSLAAIMADSPTNSRTDKPIRPAHLPPPTVLPLRHCSHNSDSTPIDEVDCLMSLLSPSSDSKKNKEHYILATADPPTPREDKDAANAKKRKRVDPSQDPVRRAQALRSGARSIPGVPIIYVKRSVVILEPLSTSSEKVRDGVERDKFKVGIASTAAGKRKREEEEEEPQKKERGLKRAKGPNPLSVKKPKKAKEDPSTQGLKQKKDAGKSKDGASEEANHNGDGEERREDGEGAHKKRRRRHKSAKAGGDNSAGPGEAQAAAAVEASE